MLRIEQLVKEKRLKTELKLNKECEGWAKEVLKLIENKTIHIPNYKNFKKTLKPTFRRIPVIELLPLVVKEIVLADIDTYGIYKTNTNVPFNLVQLYPETYSKVECPFSLDSYAGVIGIKKETLRCKESFKYTLAHELLRAIRLLPHVHPALADWNNFCSMATICLNKEIKNPCGCYHKVTDILDGKYGHYMMLSFYGNVINKWGKEEVLFLKDVAELLPPAYEKYAIL